MKGRTWRRKRKLAAKRSDGYLHFMTTYCLIHYTSYCLIH